MAIYREDIISIELESGSVNRSFLNHSIGKGDMKANRFGVSIVRNGENVALSGCACEGFFIAPDGENILIFGSAYTGISGNKAWVDLPQACYNEEGQFTLAIKVIGGGITGTMRIIDGVVNNTGVDDPVAPTETVPTYQEILALYNEMVENVGDITSLYTALKAQPIQSEQDIVLHGDISFPNDNTVILPDGVEHTDASWKTSGFYSVTGDTRIVGTGNASDPFFATFYTSEQGWISGGDHAANTAFAVPSTAAYVKISAPKIYTRFDICQRVSESYDIDYMGVMVQDVDFIAVRTVDLNTLDKNTITFINVQTTLQNGPSGFNDYKDGSTWAIHTLYAKLVNDVDYKIQWISNIPEDPNKRRAVRYYTNGSWGTWYILAGASSSVGNEYHVGSGQEYTTLKAGIQAAYNDRNAVVYVHPGTYDLISEFASEIASGSGTTIVGNALGKGMRIVFMDGTKVTALFNSSDYDSTKWEWIYNYFNPFYAGDGDYTLENLTIEAKDCRYCVHDEMGGIGDAIHKYINCKMKYKNTHSTVKYVQCIGGGLGLHGTIVIDGGFYQSDTDYGYPGMTSEESQQPISFHNGAASGCESSISIKDVYLADKGYFRFGYYGASTKISKIMICGCSTGEETVKRAEDATAQVDNFEVIEWNGIIRS